MVTAEQYREGIQGYESPHDVATAMFMQKIRDEFDLLIEQIDVPTETLMTMALQTKKISELCLDALGNSRSLKFAYTFFQWSRMRCESGNWASIEAMAEKLELSEHDQKTVLECYRTWSVECNNSSLGKITPKFIFH